MSNDAQSGGDGSGPSEKKIDWSQQMFFGPLPTASPTPAPPKVDPAATQVGLPAAPTVLPFSEGASPLREPAPIRSERPDFTGTLPLLPDPPVPPPALVMPPATVVEPPAMIAAAPAPAPIPVPLVVHSTPAEEPAQPPPMKAPARKKQVAAVPARPPRAWMSKFYEGFGVKK